MTINRNFFINSVISLVIIAIATGLSLTLFALGINKESIIMVFLLGVLLITVTTRGYTYGIISSLLAVMLFNYFFTDPIYTFVIYSTSDIVLLVFFEITAIVSGSVTSRLRMQKELSLQNEQIAKLLSKLATGFLHVTGKDNILRLAQTNIQEYTSTQADFYFQEEPPRSPLANEFNFTYLLSNQGTLVVTSKQQHLSKAQDLIIRSIAAQVAIALDREYMYNERETIKIAMESEKLRNALLRSVAHDLRTPLTTLSGASQVFIDGYDKFTQEEKKQLATDISEEIIWLSNLVENILNMTKISEARLGLDIRQEVIDDVVGEAVEHMKRLLKNRTFQMQLPNDVITIPVDGKLIVQVIINLLDNAIKHTKEKDEITLSVEVTSTHARFLISDQGVGVDPKISKRLFQSYTTSSRLNTDGKRGSGLGLAICKSIVEAHHGTIGMKKNQPKGSVFWFDLPREKHDGK